jgi:hypothetical protein
MWGEIKDECRQKTTRKSVENKAKYTGIFVFLQVALLQEGVFVAPLYLTIETYNMMQ